MGRKLNPMVSNVVLIFVFLVYGCNNKQITSNEKANKEGSIAENMFVPDSSINGRLFLHNDLSLSVFYPNKNSLKFIEFIRESPIVAFCNTSKSEYLYAYQYEGNMKNEFSFFEIGYNDNNNESYTLTEYSRFETESGLRLGMTLKDVEAIKGRDYTRNDNKITFQITDSNSEFLHKHNMPKYVLQCRLEQNKVVEIKLGFLYP